jgi:GNAT superfamily N-acetyltransferase
MAIEVRPARREDHDAWRPLWDGYNEFYERSCLVAVEGGALVGLAHIIFHRNTTMAGPVCYLQDLFARADMRGRGVGRALIEAVYARAREAGAPRVYWHTHETNVTAMRLYDAVADRPGFVLYRKNL